MKKSLFFILIIISMGCLNAQNSDNNSYACKLAAKNLFKVFNDNIGSQSNIKQVVVVPIYNSSFKIDDNSVLLSQTITKELGILFQKNDLNFNVRTFEDDSLITKNVQTTFLTKEKEVDYWKKLATCNNVDYYILAYYEKKDDIIIIYNMQITNNVLNEAERVNKYADDVDIEKIINRKALVKSTFPPGFGQFYKHQNLKGTLFLVTTIGSLTSGLITFPFSKYYLNESDGDTDSNDYTNYLICKNVSIGSFIGCAFFYSLNLIDAYSSKNKNTNKSVSLNNIKFYNEYSYNYNWLIMRIYF